MQNCTFKRQSFKQKHWGLWNVWNRPPVCPDLCNIAGSDLWSQTPYGQVFNSIPTTNTPDNALECIDSWMFSKSAPKHKVCQVHQGHDDSRTKPAPEPCLKLTVPWKSQGRHSKRSADQCIGKTTLGSLPESSLLARFVSLLLPLDLKLRLVKRYV